MLNPSGGSEWRTVSLYRHLREHADVKIWRFRQAQASSFTDVEGRAIDIRRLSFPRGGNLVFIGVYFDIGKWIWLARPRRVILTYNTPDPVKLAQRIELIRRACAVEPEIVFCSQELAGQVPFAGTIEPSLVDLAVFLPRPGDAGVSFTVGRLSRDTPEKHHPNDMALYQKLVQSGCIIDVMGATAAMRTAAEGATNFTLRPIGDVDAPDFLRSLDCFFYRTSPEWAEPWGRVIIEAMASGVPVVTDRRSGASRVIDHGRNGLLFDTDEEAIAAILSLKADPVLRRSIGKAARETAEAILSDEVRERVRNFYLGGIGQMA